MKDFILPWVRGNRWCNPDGTLTIEAISYLDRLSQMNCRFDTATVTDDALLVDEDFNGDTAITLETGTIVRQRVGSFAAFSLRLDVRGFSSRIDNDATFRFRFDIGALAESEGWILPKIDGDGYGQSEGEFLDIGFADFPVVPFKCEVTGNAGGSFPDTVKFSNNDRTHLTTATTNADQLLLSGTFTAKVFD